MCTITLCSDPPRRAYSRRAKLSGREKLLVRAHGFDTGMIAGLVRTGLATAERESVNTRGKTIEVIRVRITDAGRRAIESNLP